jgi:hypothetical protein
MDLFDTLYFTSGQHEEQEHFFSTLPNDLPVDSEAQSNGLDRMCIIA